MQKLKSVQEIFLVVLLLLIIGCGKEPVLDEYVDADTDTTPETNDSPEITTSFGVLIKLTYTRSEAAAKAETFDLGAKSTRLTHRS